MRRWLIILVFLVLFVITGTNCLADLPVTNGLVAHWDANSLTGLSDGDTVTVWPDISGNGHDAYVGTDTDEPNKPKYKTNVLNGLPVVRFGANNSYFTFSEISDIRTVFWVLMEPFDASGQHFLLGHSSSYDFHRGWYYCWDLNWASDFVKNGLTRKNGVDWISVGDQDESWPGAEQLPYDEYLILSLTTTGNVSANQLTRDRSYTNHSWQGDIAEIIIYNRPLTSIEENMVGYYLSQKYGINTAYTSDTSPYATNPYPEDSATSVPTTGVTLAWDVAFASDPKYDVWFGPQGSMTKVSSSQDANSYTVTGPLVQDQVYEWRIDVNDGGVLYPAETSWTFRTALSATKILEWKLDSTYDESATHEIFISDVTVTASSQDWGEASATLNDNGLYGMKHIVYPYGYSWISANGGGSEPHPVDGSTSGWGAWIAYEFNDVYPVGNMYIWNHNQVYYDDLTNRGLRNVTIQYSTNGSVWNTLGSYEIPKATGQDGMPPSLVVDFGGASAKYVVITAAETDGQWGYDPGSTDTYYALAKVRFGIDGTSAVNIMTQDTAGYGLSDANGLVRGNPQIVQGISDSSNCSEFTTEKDDVVAYISDPNFPAAGDQQWSMNCYVYLDEEPSTYDIIAGFGRLIGWPDGSVRYIINYNDQIYFWGNNAFDLATGVPFDIAQWQMITVTYDGGILKVYKNGGLIGSKKITAFEDASPVVCLAAKSMAGGGHAGKFKGKIDNFTIYKGVLSQTEIDALTQELPLGGNFNRDPIVNFEDYAIFGERWGTNTLVQGWPTLMLLDMEGPNALDAWSVPDTWNSGVATVELILGDANNPNDPNQPFGGTQAIRMRYDNTGENKWSSVDVNFAEPVDMTKYDLLRIHLKRHVGNSREPYMFFRGYSPDGDELFDIQESYYSTDTPAGVWEQQDGGNNGNIVIWSDQIPFAHEVKILKIGVRGPWEPGESGGTGTIDIDDITLEKFDNCLGTILEGDFNANCVIDFEDMAVFINNWLKTE